MRYSACEMLGNKSGDVSVFFEADDLNIVLEVAENIHFNSGLSVEVVEYLGLSAENTIHMYF